MKKILLVAILCILIPLFGFPHPIKELLERIDKGASQKFDLCLQKNLATKDYFEISNYQHKIRITANNYSAMAMGINWYLKYHLGIHLSRNGMHAKLPTTLPPVEIKERHACDVPIRYNYNYCTFSYTMAFWGWKEWEQEIDWMALHGINTPLALVGTAAVWRNVLLRLGYTEEEVSTFIAGPAYQAWWMMNNLEGWGGPNPLSWYEQQTQLQKKIVERLHEFDIEPVFAGYAGMVPSNAKEKLGLNVANPGKWCSYQRPAFLLPTDSQFRAIASIYYEELTKLFGKANYYAIDPFHEGGSTRGVALDIAGKAIYDAMKDCNPNATWVAQAWQNNPKMEMIEGLDDVLILDLCSESRPKWGDPRSVWYQEGGYGSHDWAFCMLLNFGGNVGLHGKMQHLIDSYHYARTDTTGSPHLKGIGLTYEGCDNNPIMYELMTELPWRETPIHRDDWIADYCFARYGTHDTIITQAWLLLANSIYNCPQENTQEGTNESIFCARPSNQIRSVSTWANSQPYYSAEDVIKAGELLHRVYRNYKGNTNFEYDFVDVTRQAVAEKGKMIYNQMMVALNGKNKAQFTQLGTAFIHLLHLQDKLLGTRKEFRVGNWIHSARERGTNAKEKRLYEWNARCLISTWGNREAADEGGLHDYAHREWNGILRAMYAERWKAYIAYERLRMEYGTNQQQIREAWQQLSLSKHFPLLNDGPDYYAFEANWSKNRDNTTRKEHGDLGKIGAQIYEEIRK